MLQINEKEVSLVQKVELLLRVFRNEETDDLVRKLTAEQKQDLRNFLEKEVIYLSRHSQGKPLSLAEIKSRFEPIPNYYYRQECNEPLEACFNETCIEANPQCFGRKMEGQISVMVQILSETYFNPEAAAKK